MLSILELQTANQSRYRNSVLAYLKGKKHHYAMLDGCRKQNYHENNSEAILHYSSLNLCLICRFLRAWHCDLSHSLSSVSHVKSYIGMHQEHMKCNLTILLRKAQVQDFHSSTNNTLQYLLYSYSEDSSLS